MPHSQATPRKAPFSAAASLNIVMDFLSNTAPDKVERMTELFRSTGVDQSAQQAKKAYMGSAYFHLGKINVPENNKTALRQLAEYLLERNS